MRRAPSIVPTWRTKVPLNTSNVSTHSNGLFAHNKNRRLKNNYSTFFHNKLLKFFCIFNLTFILVSIYKRIPGRITYLLMEFILGSIWRVGKSYYCFPGSVFYLHYLHSIFLNEFNMKKYYEY